MKKKNKIKIFFFFLFKIKIKKKKKKKNWKLLLKNKKTVQVFFFPSSRSVRPCTQFSGKTIFCLDF